MRQGVVRVYNANSDQIISIRLLGKPINIIIIQVYALTRDADENKIKSFYASAQEETDRTPKQQELMKAIEDRTSWRPMIHTVTINQKQFDDTEH